jgi:sec-independent protein translocase protein TatA
MVGDILQPTHLLFILVVALLVLGPKRLPEVGRTLGSGLRDFRAAINGETHDDPAPRAYVETEPDAVPPLETDGSETEPASLDTAAELDASAAEPATATALHEHRLDPEALGDDLHAPEAIEDLQPPAATDDLQATGDLHPPAATDDPQPADDLHPPAATDDLQPADDLHPPAPADDLQPTDELRPPAATDEGDAVLAPVATASSNGFASALASSRQRPAGGEPAADDE